MEPRARTGAGTPTSVLILAVAAAAALAGPAPAHAGDGPASCAAGGVLESTVTRGYFNAPMRVVSGPCVAIAISPRSAVADPWAESVIARTTLSVALTMKGIVLTFHLPDETYRAGRRVGGVGMNQDDTVALLFFAEDAPAYAQPAFTAVANARFKCATLSRNAFLGHDLCHAARARADAWAGSLTVSLEQLRAAGLRGRFEVSPRVRLWSKRDAAHQVRPYVYEGVSGSEASRVRVVLHDGTDIISQQFAIVATDIGNHANGIPRRTGADTWYPLSRNTLFTATAADDSGGLLNERTKIMNGVVPNTQLLHEYDCRSCYTFQQNDNDAFAPLLKTSDLVGIDFQPLGLDVAPIDFGSLSAPIDSGVKLISQGDDGIVAVARFKGTNGATTFDDAAYRFAARRSTDTSSVRYGVFHVLANHSAPPSFATAPRSVTTIGSFALQTVRRAPDARDPVRGWTTLVRYGTQYVPNSQHVALLESFDASPGPKGDNAIGEQTTMHYAVGYRDVGARYLPYDAPVDPLGGTRGLFAGVGFDRRVVDDSDAPSRDRSLKPLKGSVILHRFGDRAAVRDQAVAAHAELDVWHSATLRIDRSLGAVSASVAGRSAGLLVSDVLGRRLFDNSQTSISLLTTRDRLAWSIGYQRLSLPNCSTKVRATAAHPLPCDPYRQATATASVFVPIGAHGFLGANVGNSFAEPFADTFMSSQTTVMRLRRSLAFGVPVASCSHLIALATNRAGDIDQSTQARDRPGMYLAGFLEVALRSSVPQAVLLGFVRNQDFSADPRGSAKREFFARVVTGAPQATIRHMVQKCPGPAEAVQ